MTKICDIYNYIETFAKSEFREDFDNDGIMLCKNVSSPVKTAVVCLEINEQCIDFASENKAQLIITHHPYIFRPLKHITGTEYSNTEKLMKNNISVISFHTRLDCAQGGVNDALAASLCLSDIMGFAGKTGHLGRIGKTDREYSPLEFAEFIREKLSCGTVRAAFPDKNMKIKTAAVLGGAGKDYICEAKLSGADAYVTADLSHNSFIDAKNLGLAIFDAGHYYTENVIVDALMKKIGGKFSEVNFLGFDVKSPYINI